MNFTGLVIHHLKKKKKKKHGRKRLQMVRAQGKSIWFPRAVVQLGSVPSVNPSKD